MELEDAQVKLWSSLHRVLELAATMDIGILVPPADCSSAQPGSNMVSETGHCQQGTQSGVFSVLLDDAVKKTESTQTQPSSDAGDPIEQAIPTAVDADAAGASLIDIPVEAGSQMPLIQAVVWPVADKAEAIPDSTEYTQQGIEWMLLVSQGVAEAVPHDDGTMGDESLSAAPPQARPTDASMSASLQPLVDPAQVAGEAAMATKQPALRIQGESPIRNGSGSPADLVTVPLEQPSGDAALPRTLLSDSLTSNQKPIPVIEQHGERNVSSAGHVNGNAQALDRPSPDTRPSSIIQEQGEQATAVPGQSPLVRMVGGSGGQDPFGAFAQGGGEGTGGHSSANEAPEPGMRGTQSTLFSDSFTSARQTQSLPQGVGTSVSTPVADQLKLAQAFLGEEHSATMTAVRGMAQTVQVMLPSHEAGPLSVRISMTDQTVHAQLTTDRSDLGAILLGRQDQLQQSLTKSGLELGQFQVYVNREDRQEAFQDRQSRRNGWPSEEQPTSQGHREQSHDQERPHQRSTRALSLFA
jgi:hypothetical protein